LGRASLICNKAVAFIGTKNLKGYFPIEWMRILKWKHALAANDGSMRKEMRAPVHLNSRGSVVRNGGGE